MAMMNSEHHGKGRDGDEPAAALSLDRQHELRAMYQAASDQPYGGVHIHTLDELQWILSERGWSGKYHLPENMKRANLRGAVLRGARLGGVELREAQLDGADLSSADLREAALSGCTLTDANLSHADLTMAYLLQANLTGANLSHAVLTGTKLRDAILRGTNLNNTSLRSASLIGTDLRGANLHRADLRGVDLSSIQINDADLREAELSRTLRRKVVWEYQQLSTTGRVFQEERIENVSVACTAYYPTEVYSRRWDSLLVYLSRDDEKTLTLLANDANERLARHNKQYRPISVTGKSRIGIGAQLSIVPTLDGFRFNPPSLITSWEEDLQSHEFRLMAEAAAPNQSVNGKISVFAGPFLFAEIPLAIYVNERLHSTEVLRQLASVGAHLYRNIFASYSHKDTDIVRFCMDTAIGMGDRFLIDSLILRSGQNFTDELMKAISVADVFQLFWSKNAAESEFVAKEWKQALGFVSERPNFVRPLYWTDKPYTIPTELSAIHFEHLKLHRARKVWFWR